MLNFGLIGCGRFGKHYISNLENIGNARVTRVCTRTLLDRMALGVTYHTDYRDVCDANDINCVIVATPPALHYDICKAALIAGKHVICEKPFVFDLSQAKELEALAEQQHLSLLVNYIHLFNPDFVRVTEEYDPLDSSLKYIESEGYGWGPFRADCTVAWDWMSHDIAMLFSIFGCQFAATPVSYQDPADPFRTMVDLGLAHANIRAVIRCGNTAFSKKRRFSIRSEKQSLEYIDDASANPLLIMLERFVAKALLREIYSNSALACDVTGFLQRTL